MRISVTMLRGIAMASCAALFVLGNASKAGAQGFISPFIGYNFGGDSGCPEVTNCDRRSRNLGVAFGTVGNVFGGEVEFNFIDSFFGDTPGVSSNVFTLMGNIMFAPKLGLVQPYVVAGTGLMKTHVEFTPTTLIESNENKWAWNIGGGVIGYFTPHFGVRGDLRYFHSFQPLEVIGLSLSNTKIDYGRASGSVVFRF